MLMATSRYMVASCSLFFVVPLQFGLVLSSRFSVCE